MDKGTPGSCQPNLGATYGPFSVAIGPNACVPTATAIGLSYLENYLNVTDDTDPFTTSPNSYAQGQRRSDGHGKSYNTTKSGAGGWTNVGGTLVPSIYKLPANYLANGGSQPGSIGEYFRPIFALSDRFDIHADLGYECHRGNFPAGNESHQCHAYRLVLGQCVKRQRRRGNRNYLGFLFRQHIHSHRWGA